jgi:hypothetical protein
MIVIRMQFVAFSCWKVLSQHVHCFCGAILFRERLTQYDLIYPNNIISYRIIFISHLPNLFFIHLQCYLWYIKM